MRLFSGLILLTLPLLAACNPPIPDSAAGVGFDTGYGQQGVAPVRPTGIVPPGFSQDVIGAAINRADGQGTAVAGQPLNGVAPSNPAFPAQQQGTIIGAAPTTTAPIVAPIAQTAALPTVTPVLPQQGAVIGAQPQVGGVVPVAGNAAISDEQDFNAVSQRETIESDAQRIARNRQQYVVIQPGALPTRPGELGPNIVDYALASNHPVGTPMYRRNRLFAKDSVAACAAYASPELAQEAFLASGGPNRDRQGLDPDGDGYACAWDPAPFRIQ